MDEMIWICRRDGFIMRRGYNPLKYVLCLKGAREDRL